MLKKVFRFTIPFVASLALIVLWNGSHFRVIRGAQAPQGARAPAAAEGTRQTTRIDRAPERVIKDPYAGFSAVAVDVAHNEIILQDENRAQIAVYGRTDNTPPQATLTEPKRTIGGGNTKIQHNCGVYGDPNTEAISSINEDITQYLTAWCREKKGNVAADRMLETPHRTYGIAVDEETQEMFITTQHPAAVLVWRKSAQGTEAPLRILE